MLHLVLMKVFDRMPMGSGPGDGRGYVPRAWVRSAGRRSQIYRGVLAGASVTSGRFIAGLHLPLTQHHPLFRDLKSLYILPPVGLNPITECTIHFLNVSSSTPLVTGLDEALFCQAAPQSGTQATWDLPQCYYLLELTVFTSIRELFTESGFAPRTPSELSTGKSCNFLDPAFPRRNSNTKPCSSTYQTSKSACSIS